MYSFYGGQKGQDFRISKIFENRSEDLLKDLQARWYSSINVGDYVFINYGNIADSDKINITSEGKIEEIPSNYNRNLNIDLLNCGKSYTNSIWQKVYIDDSKEISPQFPDSENNVFVFINFEENEVLQDSNNNYYVQINDGNVLRKQPTDKNGNWIDQNGNIIRLTQQPGHSLREVVDIYSEEYYGFGYRLIACVTGATPRLQVYHQTINIEDGNPYVTCDLTNPDKPAIKFYQQRAQRIEKVFNQTIAPTKAPEVRILTNGETRLDAIASLTKPILEMNLPRAIQYHTGQLFGKDRNISNSTSYTKENTFSDFNPGMAVAIVHREEALRAKAAAEFFHDLLTQYKEVDEENSNKRIFSIDSKKIKTILFDNEKKYVYECLYNYYYPDGLLKSLESVDNNKFPYGQYSFREDNINNINKIKEILRLINECNTGEDVRGKVAEAENKLEFVKLLEETGFMPFDIYEQLSSEIQTNYLNRFKSGFAAGSLTMLINLLPPSNLNITDFLLNINEKSYDASYVYMVSQFLLMIMGNFDTHFDQVVTYALPGDIYLNNAVGKIYQIINIDNSTNKKSISAIYLGKMTSPPPFATTKQVSPYIKDSEGNFKPNEITIENNLMSYGEDLSLNEQYIFSVPKMPKFNCDIERSDEKKVELTFEDEDTQKFTFKFPFGAHIFTNQPNQKITFSNDDLIINSNSDKYNLNDIFIYLEDNSERNGNVYTYTQSENKQYVWKKTGSIRGPVGTVPQPKAEFCFINKDDQSGVSEVPSNDFKYIYDKPSKMSVENALKTIKGILPPSFLKSGDFFYVQIFVPIPDNTRSSTGEQSETIELEDAQLIETWWAYYKGDNVWATSLMTGNVAIATGKTEDTDNQSYSVKYINNLIGNIDSDTTVKKEIEALNNLIGNINSDSVANEIEALNNEINTIKNTTIPNEITKLNNEINTIKDTTIPNEITKLNNEINNEIQGIKGLITWKILGEGS